MATRSRKPPGGPRRALWARVGTVGVVACGLGAWSLSRAEPSGAIALRGRGSASVSASPLESRLANRRFFINGTVTGFYPGATLPLTLKVTNPEPWAIVVTSISTQVGGASSGCPSGYLSVGPFSGHLKIPPRSWGSLQVLAQLNHAAPDACQGVVFPLSYLGKAARG